MLMAINIKNIIKDILLYLRFSMVSKGLFMFSTGALRYNRGTPINIVRTTVKRFTDKKQAQLIVNRYVILVVIKHLRYVSA